MNDNVIIMNVIWTDNTVKRKKVYFYINYIFVFLY